MSRRTTTSLRQTREIRRVLPVEPVGSRIASSLLTVFWAALSCGPVGACIVTSAEEFPEEPQVAPIVLDTPDLPVGSIVAFDQNSEPDLRLTITVRDDNIDDPMEIQARLSVVGQPPYDFYCSETGIPPNGTTTRQYELPLDPSRIKQGACSRVEVVVSSRFAGARTCGTNFGIPANSDDDIARATYWIFEMSGDPASNPSAAQNLINSCQTVVTRAQSNTNPTVP